MMLQIDPTVLMAAVAVVGVFVPIGVLAYVTRTKKK